MKIDREVLAVLDRSQTDGNSLTLVGQLDRRLYERTNKVLEAAGGKWNRKAKAHIFTSSAADAVEQIVLTGEISVPRDFGFFPTPPPVVERLIELADITPGMKVLEPSAGTGNIVAGLHSAGAMVDAVELLDSNVAALKAQGLATTVDVGDFLKKSPRPTYDRVVMNPPFGRQDDIRHVTHALQFLKPTGLLVSVMSAAITFRSNKLTTDFRDLIHRRGGDIEELPEGSFKSSKTNINTVIVTIKAQ